MRLTLIAIVALPATLLSQTVPLLSLELTIGDGGGTTHTATADYSHPPTSMLRFAGSIRLGGPGTVRPFLSFEHSPSLAVESGLVGDTCDVFKTPCRRRDLSIPEGDAFGAGVRAAVGSRIIAGAGTGIGLYQHQSFYVSSDIELRIARHISVVADVRRIMWREGDREPINYHPLSFGLRLH